VDCGFTQTLHNNLLLYLTNPVGYLGCLERSLHTAVSPYKHLTSGCLIEDTRLTLGRADLNHLAVGCTHQQYHTTI